MKEVCAESLLLLSVVETPVTSQLMKSFCQALQVSDWLGCQCWLPLRLGQEVLLCRGV